MAVENKRGSGAVGPGQNVSQTAPQVSPAQSASQANQAATTAPKPRLTRLIDSLPQRFRWTPHNLIAHPLSEVLFQLGFEELGNKLHDVTVPTHEKGTGRG